jgi:hypothetical protein
MYPVLGGLGQHTVTRSDALVDVWFSVSQRYGGEWSEGNGDWLEGEVKGSH